MYVWLERVAFLQILNCDSATKFDAGGRSAQTFPLCFLGNVRTAHLQRHLSAKYMEHIRCFNECQYNTPAFYQTAENCFCRLSNFSVMGDQKWKKNGTVRFEQNIPSPHQLTLERAKGDTVDPLSL